MSEAQDPPLGDPPDPPELPRRIHLYRAQWIGLPILFALPVLAVLDVFGERRSVVDGEYGAISIAVDYPTRLRSGQRTDAHVRIVNRGTEALDNVGIQWDSRFLAGFAEVERGPPNDQAADATFALGPGEEMLQRMLLEGGALWRHSGHVAITLNGRDTGRIHLRTFVLP